MLLYRHLKEAVFLRRPNRFIAYCLVDGAETVCHVKNTGRCRELLIPGCRVWLEHSDATTRKTVWDLVCTECGGLVINMDSQAPNRVFDEWARSGGYMPGLTDLKAEVTCGESRFDFAWKKDGVTGYTEVKGVTLFDEQDVAVFPDAPTERGAKHLRELARLSREGVPAGVCFVIQRERITGLRPNEVTDPAFSLALRDAAKAGVRITAAVCRVTPESLTIDYTVPVRL